MFRTLWSHARQIYVLGGAKETIYKIPLHSEQSGMVREITLVVPSETLSAASSGATEVSHIVIRDFNFSTEPLSLVVPRPSFSPSSGGALS